MVSSYTGDEQIAEDFAERQGLYSGGRDALQETLEEHHSLSPGFSSGDVDAAWEDSDVAGEEFVGGSVLTPDQCVVDDLGEAAGLTYRDDEPLDSIVKLRRQDEDRWELDPRSIGDEEGGFEEEQPFVTLASPGMQGRAPAHACVQPGELHPH